MAELVAEKDTHISFKDEEVEKMRLFAEKSVERLLSSSMSAEKNCDGQEWGSQSLKDEELRLDVWSSSVPGNSLKMFKAQCTFDGHSPKEIYDFLMNNDKRLGWDENVCHLDIMVLSEDKSTGEKLVILNCRTNAVGPISGRDFVDICLWKKITDEKGGTVTYISAGASYLENDDIKRKIDEHFPLPRGFIRGTNFQGGGWHISAGDRGAVVTYGIHTDLAGWFPAIVVNNAIAGSYASFFRSSKNAL